MTPRYFVRPECRRELLDFYGQAKSRELVQLIMPILYVPTPNLTVENQDEAIAIVAQMQWTDWTDLRLAGQGSVEYRRAVNGAALRLVDLTTDVSEIQLERELEDSSKVETQNEDELEALLVRAEELWPDWIDAVDNDVIRQGQHDALVNGYQNRRSRLRRANGTASQRLAVDQQHARDELPLARAYRDTAEVYLSRTIQLDPIIKAIVRFGAETASARVLLMELRDRISLAVEVIDKQPNKIEGTGTTRKFVERTMPFVTRAWAEIIEVTDKGERLVLEANSLVRAWASDLDAILFETGEARNPAREIES